MGVDSGVSWCNHTVNFWTGCKKVSPGCKFCYMYRDKERYGKDPSDVVQVNQKTIDKVLREAKPGDKIFTCSWSDFFIEEADKWRDWAWDIIRKHPQFVWQILTKRPERIKDCLPEDWGDGWENVWLGVSVEDQDRANERIPILLTVPSFTTFISYEPALGPVDFTKIVVNDAQLFAWSFLGKKLEPTTSMVFNCLGDSNELMPYTVDWIIMGGESGNNVGKYTFRPAHLDWFESTIQQCKEHNVSLWIKQMGTFLGTWLALKDRHGTDIKEWPEHLQIQQFPE